MPILQQSYKINGTPFKRPDSFKIERFNLTDLQRIASGEMCGDLIAKKRKFYFTYDSITSDQLETIFNLIWEIEDLFYELTYIENNVSKTATVYVGSIPTELVRTGAKWVWKNVTFNLIEK
jgi:hypothetical protein